MHTKPVDQKDGQLGTALICQVKCPQCGHHHGNTYQNWQSDCGGYEDTKFTCASCGHAWWVDGSDS